MGLPALDMRGRGVPARPRLRLIKGSSAVKRGVRVSSARHDQRCRELFNVACVVMIGLTLFGLGRVMLSARAAETAMESGVLQSDIKEQRLAGDLLEVDKSALATPSRIEGIAGATLKMAAAPEVDYLCLPSSSTTATPAIEGGSVPIERAAQVSTADVGGGLTGMLSSVMEMAAGEAELLLVGDAGLASAR